MKTLRLILLIITSIAIIFLLVGFLLPEKIHVERSIYINTPQPFAFNQINTVKNWKNWSSWLTTDTLTDIRYSGPESGVGAGLTWKSQDRNLGGGSLKIIYALPADSVLFISDYGNKGKLSGRILLRKENQGVIVTWIVETDLKKNPLSRWIGLFSDDMIGPDLMKTLFSLKQDLEKAKPYNGYEVFEYELPSRIILSIRDTTVPANLSAKLSRMNEKMVRFIKKEGLSPAGPPFTVYHAFSDSIFEIESCMQLPLLIKAPAGMSLTEIEPQMTVMVKHFGYNKKITAAYTALNNYINDRGLQIVGPPWEEYVTNPVLVDDTAKWQINVYYPIK
jgi:effector-binding domain-containing protein